MKKKLQVFISSTYIDLIEERQSAVQAVLDAGHIPAGMELFKAGNRTQLETINKWIDDSDVYMLILGGRYGSVEEESQKSYTHLEYEYAISCGKPVFAVVLSDVFLNTKQDTQTNKDVFESMNVPKYKEFKSLVMTKIIRNVDDAKDIMLAIHTTLKDFLEEYELVGWVRGDDTEATNLLLRQTNELHLRNRNLEKEIESLKAKLNELQLTSSDSIAFEGDSIIIEGTYTYYDGHGTPYSKTTRKTISWDKMFLLWAPRLLSTLNAIKAKHELENALFNLVEQHVSIKENQFNEIKIQYYALGLINAFESNTTAGGTAEFISLTKAGKKYLVQNGVTKTSQKDNEDTRTDTNK